MAPVLGGALQVADSLLNGSEWFQSVLEAGLELIDSWDSRDPTHCDN